MDDGQYADLGAVLLQEDESRGRADGGNLSRHDACHLSGGACPGTEAVLTAALATCQRFAPAVLSVPGATLASHGHSRQHIEHQLRASAKRD
jgi:hypothetical protein